MTTKREVSPEVQVLMAAKDVLEARGWCQFRGVGEGGRVCLAAAIQMAAVGVARNLAGVGGWVLWPPHLMPMGVIKAASDLLPPPVRENIPHWNDHAGRTKEEVLETLDAAIAQGMGACVLQEAVTG